MRPNQLAQIKPEILAGDDEAARQTLRPFVPDRPRMKLLFPNCPTTGRQRDKEKRSQPQSVAPAPLAIHPPPTKAEHDWQHHRGRFAENCQRRAKQRQCVLPLLTFLSSGPAYGPPFQEQKDREKIE